MCESSELRHSWSYVCITPRQPYTRPPGDELYVHIRAKERLPDLNPSRWRSLYVEFHGAIISTLLPNPQIFNRLQNLSLQGTDMQWHIASLHYLPALADLRMKVTTAQWEGICPPFDFGFSFPSLRLMSIENFEYRTTIIAMIYASDGVETLTVTNAVDRKYHTAGLPATFPKLHTLTFRKPLHCPASNRLYVAPDVLGYCGNWDFPALTRLCIDDRREHGPDPPPTGIVDNILRRPDIAGRLTYLRLCLPSGPLDAIVTQVATMDSLTHFALYNPETTRPKVESMDDALGDALNTVSHLLENHSSPPSFPSLEKFDYYTPFIRASATFPPLFRFILAVWRNSSRSVFSSRFPKSACVLPQEILDASAEGLSVVCDLERFVDLY